MTLEHIFVAAITSYTDKTIYSHFKTGDYFKKRKNKLKKVKLSPKQKGKVINRTRSQMWYLVVSIVHHYCSIHYSFWFQKKVMPPTTKRLPILNIREKHSLCAGQSYHLLTYSSSVRNSLYLYQYKFFLFMLGNLSQLLFPAYLETLRKHVRHAESLMHIRYGITLHYSAFHPNF